jgi:HSP20 family molecular chaperone IbpA
MLFMSVKLDKTENYQNLNNNGSEKIYWNKFKPIFAPITGLLFLLTAFYIIKDSPRFLNLNEIYKAVLQGSIVNREHFEYIYKQKDSDRIAIKMPSFTKDQLNIELHDQALVIKADKKDKNNLNKLKYILRLEKDMNVDKIESSFENEILTIYVPNVERKTRTIKIN